jgi:hypothetical protein
MVSDLVFLPYCIFCPMKGFFKGFFNDGCCPYYIVHIVYTCVFVYDEYRFFYMMCCDLRPRFITIGYLDPGWGLLSP